jgi:3-dehydrosphinganine reductase
MDFRGKKVAITGGNSGIGRAAALQLAREGASVAILARDQGRLDAVVNELKAAGGPQARFVGVSVDVKDDASVEAAAAAVLAGLGGLDVLVCNAGYAQAASVSAQPMSAFVDLMETNYLGHVRVVKAFLPHFKAQRSGAISLVTSMLGFMSFYGYAAYSGSKFAIVGFAEALRQELLPYGVSVGVFYPPTTDTPGLATENETKPELSWKIEGTSRKFTSDQVAASLLAGVAAGRFTNMIGADSWVIFYLSRWIPGVVRWVLDREVHAWVRGRSPEI